MLSSDVHSVLQSICQQIKHAYNLTKGIPEEQSKLVLTFQEFCTTEQTEKPLYILIDSLDQFKGISAEGWLSFDLCIRPQFALGPY